MAKNEIRQVSYGLELEAGVEPVTIGVHFRGTDFAAILKKDREEQLLSEFWDHGLRKHLLAAPFELGQHYLALVATKTY